MNWQENANGDFNRIKGGSPSTYWSSGLERRFLLIQKYINIENKYILDVGCGLGEFMVQFQKYSDHVYGVEPDSKKVEIGIKKKLNIIKSGAENTTFESNYFDIILLHEVLEHVDSDMKTIEECVRLIKNEGYIIIFCPNRLYPFETHGMYLRGKYHFGNIPLITYIPKLYVKLTPHVRNYTKKRLFKLFETCNYNLVVNTYVFPGFDSFVNRHHRIGPRFKVLLQSLEDTPLEIFGISHFVILKISK